MADERKNMLFIVLSLLRNVSTTSFEIEVLLQYTMQMFTKIYLSWRRAMKSSYYIIVDLMHSIKSDEVNMFPVFLKHTLEFC